MSETNRRKFLAAAGAGAAAGVVGLTATKAYGVPRSAQAARDTVVAYVEDHHGSTVTLLVGEREVVVHDRDRAPPPRGRGQPPCRGRSEAVPRLPRGVRGGLRALPEGVRRPEADPHGGRGAGHHSTMATLR